MQSLLALAKRFFSRPSSTAFTHVGWCTGLIRALLLITIAAFPFVVCFGASDVFELPKQTLLGVVSILLIALWLLRAVLAHEVLWKHIESTGWMLFYSIAIIASTVASLHALTSLLGDHGQEFGSVLTTLALAVISVITLQEFERKHWNVIAQIVILETLAIALLFLAGLIGVSPWPSQWVSSPLFSTVGDLSALLALVSVALTMATTFFFTMGLSDRPNKPHLLAWRSALSTLCIIAIAVFLIVLLLIDYKPLWAIILASQLAIYGVLVWRAQDVIKTNRWVVLFAVVLIAVAALIIPVSMIQQFPPLAFMSWGESVHITQETLRAHPVLGSGPSTFAIDVSRYQRADDLRKSFGVVFDRSHSALLTMAATIGYVGIALWLVLVGIVLARLARRILVSDPDEHWSQLSIACAGFLVVVLLMALMPATIMMDYLFWILLTHCYWCLTPSPRLTKINLDTVPRVRIFAVSLACIAVLLFPLSIWASARRLNANRAFFQAQRTDVSLLERATAIERAISLYPQQDVYYRTLGSSRLSLFDDVLTKPDTDERKQQLRVLASQALLSFQTAAALHPLSAVNEQALANGYVHLAPYVDGAQARAIEEYQHLEELEPANPAHATDLATLYIAEAESESAKADKADKTMIAKALDDANDNLRRALQLDDSFAPAHYYSAVVLERQGKLPEAIKTVEALAQGNPQDLALHIQLGALYYKNGQKDLAEKVWNAVLSVQKDYANARWYLASLYEERGQYTDAIKQLEEIQKTNPNNQALNDRIKEIQARISGSPASAPSTPAR